MKNLEYNPINGMPLDGRIRPVYVIMDNRHVIVVSDGKGNAFDCENDPYKGCNDNLIKNEPIDPTKFKFERGLSGMDF
jgi:hypothetical protein